MRTVVATLLFLSCAVCADSAPLCWAGDGRTSFRIELLVNDDFGASLDPCSFGNLLPLSFTALSTDIGTHFSWDFGDGSPESTTRTSLHSFLHPGHFTVSLTATDPYGTSSSSVE